MVKAYIILAHKSPDQLLRLIKKLDDNNSYFFIHIDKSINITQFENIKKFNSNIQFVERANSKWSSYGLVQCTLNAMKAIKNTNKHFDSIILLSGQDYPIKSNIYINNFLKESPFSLFFEYGALPNFEKWPNDNGGMYRVNKYFFGLKKYQIFLSKAINFLSTIFPFLKRKMILNMKAFAGSQWWIIDMYSLNYILIFIDNNPAFINFHKYTFASDEVFFQMILLNSQDENILNKIKNDHKRFMKWQNAGAAHPEILKTNDYDDIVQSKDLFARKFDQTLDVDILNKIDKYCLDLN